MPPLKLLTFSTLYPNNVQKSHGVFVENRMSQLAASGLAEIKVVAPVAYVPRIGFLPERYKKLSDVVSVEQRHGIEIYHPRYVLLPKISMEMAPISLYLAARRTLSAMRAAGYDFDLIDAHYFYPDGIAAVLLARHFGKPVTITARGSDIALLPTYRWPGKMIRWAIGEADGLIAVCQDLKDRLVALGADANKVRVLRNGVDLKKFSPREREQTRKNLGLAGTALLSVGNLIPLKGHDLAIEALSKLDGMTLLIAGDGPERANLEALAARLGVADRTLFLGRLAHEALAEVYSAADILLLLSTREGWANVLLEAMACGTPVVATAVGGTPEVVTSASTGELVKQRSAEAVVTAIRTLLDRQPSRDAVRAYAETFSWDATTKGQIDLFLEILLKRRPSAMPQASTGKTLEHHVI